MKSHQITIPARTGLADKRPDHELWGRARCGRAEGGDPRRSTLPLIATHENLARSMARGYAMVTGRVPAVMVHVSVGTANGVCGALNAAHEFVPILFTAGRSPLTESGLPGARRLYPLGTGDVRPSRDAARDRQMGI